MDCLARLCHFILILCFSAVSFANNQFYNSAVNPSNNLIGLQCDFEMFRMKLEQDIHFNSPSTSKRIYIINRPISLKGLERRNQYRYRRATLPGRGLSESQLIGNVHRYLEREGWNLKVRKTVHKKYNRNYRACLQESVKMLKSKCRYQRGLIVCPIRFEVCYTPQAVGSPPRAISPRKLGAMIYKWKKKIRKLKRNKKRTAKIKKQIKKYKTLIKNAKKVYSYLRTGKVYTQTTVNRHKINTAGGQNETIVFDYKLVGTNIGSCTGLPQDNQYHLLNTLPQPTGSIPGLGTPTNSNNPDTFIPRPINTFQY